MDAAASKFPKKPTVENQQASTKNSAYPNTLNASNPKPTLSVPPTVKAQTTSTPYESKSANFISPNNITSINANNSNSKSILAPNININNITTNANSSSHLLASIINNNTHMNMNSSQRDNANSSSSSGGSASGGAGGGISSSLIINGNGVSSSEVISYQRVKKTILNSSSIDDEIKIREEYLNQLASIDLNKYSFPNEHKPKTDYTYARTSSYICENKHLINDNCEMPNLCRRSRRSPQNKFLFPSLSNILNTATSLFASSTTTTSTTSSSATSSQSSDQQQQPTFNVAEIDFVRNQIDEVAQSKRRISIYQSVKSTILNTVERNRMLFAQATTSTATASSSSSQVRDNSNLRSLPLNRNLHGDLEDDTHRHQQMDGDQQSRRQVASNSNHYQTRHRSTAAAAAAAAASASTQHNQNVKYKDEATMTSPNRGGDTNYVYLENERDHSLLAACCCNRLLWLFLLLLIPLCLFGVNQMNENERIDLYRVIDKFYLHPKHESFYYVYDTMGHAANYMSEGLGQAGNFVLDSTVLGARCLVDSLAHAIDCLRSFWQYLPTILAFDALKNKTHSIKEKTANYLHDLIDYKPATTGGYDMSQNILNTNQADLMESLSLMKEKILAETMANFNGAKLVDVELVRKELDQKFNYTLSIMYNKLADQMEFTKSQATELNQVKSVIDELNARYVAILAKLQEQTEKTAELSSKQQQNYQQEEELAMKSRLKETFSDEHVSFKTLEEYVHKTFQLYHADRTGKTDFASESIGGSILFTKCTENYVDNSRWFTVFDFPITRINVSPRVIIQNSIQPGNCWAFKGSKADLFIKLAAKITPTSFSIEHIPKELSLTGTIDSAPQNFTVYGYESKDQIADDKRLLIGNYRYDNESKNTLQFFDVQHEYLDKPIAVVELKIESNAGNKDYTCLYKFRVHGKLFKSLESEPIPNVSSVSGSGSDGQESQGGIATETNLKN